MVRDKIRELRKRLKLTQGQLGKRAGCSENTIQRYEQPFPKGLAGKLEQVAQKAGHPDLALEFRQLAGKEVPEIQLDLSALTVSEKFNLEMALRLLRDESALEYLVTIIRSLTSSLPDPKKVPSANARTPKKKP